jgi:hypothetical protein
VLAGHGAGWQHKALGVGSPPRQCNATQPSPLANPGPRYDIELKSLDD